MRLIKKFTNFSSVNEEFIPKVVTKESRIEALAELSSTLDKNKLEQLNVLLLGVASFYSSADSTGSLTTYNKETGANIFPTTSTEVKKYYDDFSRGLNVEQFQMLTVVLSSFAKDLRIDTKSIGFEARTGLNAATATEKELVGSSTPSMARESYKSRR
jgi:hypothetical protein